MTGADLALAVARELDVVGGVDVLEAADQVYLLGVINRVLDDWSADWGPAYVNTISSFVLTPLLQPHTIGPSGATWTLAQRPVSIEAANVVSGTTRTPIDIIDDDEWMGLADPTVTATDPTALNYRPTHPNGSVYLYPVPGTANTVEILSRGILAQLTLTSTAVLPPGYQSALVLTAAEACALHFHAIPPQAAAAKARARIAAANTKTVRLVSDVPGAVRGGKSNILTGVGSTEWID